MVLYMLYGQLHARLQEDVMKLNGIKIEALLQSLGTKRKAHFSVQKLAELDEVAINLYQNCVITKSFSVYNDILLKNWSSGSNCLDTYARIAQHPGSLGHGLKIYWKTISSHYLR